MLIQYLDFKQIVKIFIFFTLFVCSSRTFSETLKEAYEEMLATNPELVESRATQEAAWQSYLQLRGGYFPVVALAYNVGRGKGESFSPQTINIGYTVDNIQHKMASLSQLLFDGGALANRVASAKSQYENSEQQTLLQTNKLALQTASAYLAVLRASEMEKITHENVNMYVGRLDEIRKRYQGGVGTIGDIALAQSRFEQAMVAWEQNKLAFENARSAYLEVVGHYPDMLILPEDPYPIPASLQEAKAIATQVNPAIIAEEKAMKAAWHTLNASKAVFWSPNVSLQLSASRDDNLNGITGRVTSMQGYLAFTYNIINGGSDLADVRKSAAQYEASIAHLEAKQRAIITALEQTWNELQIAKQNVASLKRGIAANKKLAIAYQKEWRIGKRSLLDVMDKQNELALLKLALINSRYIIKINSFTLLANAGVLPHYFGSNIYAQ